MKTTSVRINPLLVLFSLCFVLGMIAGLFIGFKSLLFLETQLLRLVLQYKDFPSPQIEVLAGSLNILMGILFVVILVRTYPALLHAAREQIALSHFLGCIAVGLGIGVSASAGYLGF